ncbi:uncharacterized protein MYCGRDRAFT_108068 [Zymoseptoria tritici IPO323]|uniref:Uncharacterized protein n=1 Tax=Zymoseptoria tritici (strain CBS 115943 / IPO323) TaxID=336722 RepID=F9X2Z0_ZYMTI|nr:uncharacterized protein MYCGRDRAFT_108068 [Zymoseptoria tritici IPO323]EGP89922.1 hypothetical protein MYCGRDRAFT_108068 [Zymoseptoria tritici IPO323]
MQRAQQEPPLEMSLREHLLAASQNTNAAPAPYPPPGPTQAQSHEMPYQRSEGSPHEQHHHLDPNVTGQQMPYGMAGDGMDDGMGPNSAKGKRELSTSKRAAQNRAAQVCWKLIEYVTAPH